jgi:hypothetical protein
VLAWSLGRRTVLTIPQTHERRRKLGDEPGQSAAEGGWSGREAGLAPRKFVTNFSPRKEIIGFAPSATQEWLHGG